MVSFAQAAVAKGANHFLEQHARDDNSDREAELSCLGSQGFFFCALVAHL